jgi:cell pole-organizing protein PopZ
MTQTDHQQDAGDPSMEDILASIRRILNDGEGGLDGMDTPVPSQHMREHPGELEAQHQPNQDSAHGAALQNADDAAMPPQSHALTSAPAQETATDDVFVLDQTMLIEEPAPMQTEPTAAAHDPAREPQPHGGFSHMESLPPAPEPLLAPSAAAATSASLGALVRVVSQRQTPVYRGGPTLEDMVREEIRPIVKAWLDEHLAPMVERMVRSEIERVISRASL